MNETKPVANEEEQVNAHKNVAEAIRIFLAATGGAQLAAAEPQLFARLTGVSTATAAAAAGQGEQGE